MSEAAPEPHRQSGIAERLARRRGAHLQRSRVYRALFVGAGVIVTLAGIAMLALPGPAFVVIPIGLTMLAMEFAWAERALAKALEQADKAQEKARQASPLQKGLSIAATVLAIVAFVVLALLYDIPLIPDP